MRAREEYVNEGQKERLPASGLDAPEEVASLEIALLKLELALASRELNELDRAATSLEKASPRLEAEAD